MHNKFFKKGIILGIILVLFGASILPPTVGFIKINTTIKTVGSRGYIQDLIDNASYGDTIYIPSGIYYENIVIDKSISLIGEDKNTTIIDGSNIGDVILIEADWVNISGFTIQESLYGTWGCYGIIINSNLCTISDNTFLNNGEGIYLDHSSDNKIIGNTITNSLRNGIDIQYSGDNNFISNNTVSFNGWNGINLYGADKNIITGNNACFNIRYGISVFRSTLSIISNNNISLNQNEGPGYCKAGLVLFGCISNIVINNIISSNNHTGIRLGSDFGCHNNTIKNNMISNNKYGIYIDYDAHINHVYHNNLINNNINAYCEHHQNIWYNYDLKEGNYWSDYKEKYPNAKKIWFMGIWNTPYEIEGGENKDHYPLIEQWKKPRDKTFTRNTPVFNTNLLYSHPNLQLIIRQLLGLK